MSKINVCPACQDILSGCKGVAQTHTCGQTREEIKEMAQQNKALKMMVVMTRFHYDDLTEYEKDYLRAKKECGLV